MESEKINNIILKIKYKGKEEEYFCDENDLLSESLKKFANIRNKLLEDFTFYYEDSEIKFDNNTLIKDSIFGNKESKIVTISAFLKEEKKELHENKEEEKKEDKSEKNEIQININQDEKENEINEKKENKENLEFYEDIICPICHTSAIIDKNRDNGGLSLNILNCDNFHYSKNIKFDIYNNFILDTNKNLFEMENTDMYKCDLCSSHLFYMTPPYDKLLICSCGSKVCPECDIQHNEPGHYKKEMKYKNYFCLNHNKKYASFCMDCNLNICDECKKLHETHEIIELSQIMPSNDDIMNFEEQVKKQKNMLNDFVNNIKKLFDEVIKSVENYINSYIMIEKALLQKYKDKLINYQLLKNLNNKELFKNDLFRRIEFINNENDLKLKLTHFLINIYTPINNIKEKKEKINSTAKIKTKNEAFMVYRIAEKNQIDKRVKLFDRVFVKNNKDKLSLVVNGNQEKELKEYYYNCFNYNELKVKLIERGNNAVTDMSYMFNNCKNLVSVDFSKWNNINITSMEAMFQLCPLKQIPDISQFDTQNLENIRAMFCKCINLSEIPDMNKWFNNKDNNLKNISMLFNGCKNIEKINFPKWYTPHLEDISYLFNRCLNLKEITNLSKLNTSNVTDMSGLFSRCEKLTQIQGIGGWSNHFLQYMDYLFQSCFSLEKICELKWNTIRVKSMKGIFSGCKKLKAVPNSMAKWSTYTVKEMDGMFKECLVLERIPDLGKWDVNNVIDAAEMFYKCEKLKTLPKGLLNWKFNKNVILDNIFDQCSVENKQVFKETWEKI